MLFPAYFCRVRFSSGKQFEVVVHTLVYKLKFQTFRVGQKRVQNQYCVIKEEYTRGCVNCTIHTNKRCVHMIGDVPPLLVVNEPSPIE